MTLLLGILLGVMTCPMPAIASGDAAPEEENMPYLFVVRHTFEGEREHLGTIDYKIRSEHGKLYADGRFEDPYVDTGWMMPGKDREHYKAFSGKYLAASYDLNAPEKLRAFATSPGFTPEHVTTYSYLVVEPLGAKPQARDFSDFTSKIRAIPSELLDALRDIYSKLLETRARESDSAAGRAPALKAGWQFSLTDAVSAMVQAAFTTNGADFIKQGNRYLEEAGAMRLSGDPEIEKAGAALDHLGLWLSSLGWKSLTTGSPAEQSIADRFHHSLQATPEPEAGTVLLLGTAVWVWDQGTWNRADIPASNAPTP